MKTRATLEANLAEARERLDQLQSNYRMDLETGLKTYHQPEAIAATEVEIGRILAEMTALDSSPAPARDTSMELPVDARVQSTWAKAFAGVGK